jgi:hypothetical protein
VEAQGQCNGFTNRAQMQSIKSAASGEAMTPEAVSSVRQRSMHLSLHSPKDHRQDTKQQQHHSIIQP